MTQQPVEMQKSLTTKKVNIQIFCFIEKFYDISVDTQQLNGDVGPVSLRSIVFRLKTRNLGPQQNCDISVISVEDVGPVQAEEEEARELPASPTLQQGQQVPLTRK